MILLVIYLHPKRVVLLGCLCGAFGVPLTCFDNNLKLRLAGVTVYATVFSFICNIYMSILLLCFLCLLFVEFMITMFE